VNLSSAGLVVLDPSNPSFPTNELVIQEGGAPLVVPISLSAPADQDVTVEITPELAVLLDLNTNSITFTSGETGPKQFEIYAPDDGVFMGETPTELEFIFSSINTGYNNLPNVKIPVKIWEDRMTNILVRLIPTFFSCVVSGWPTVGTHYGFE
jgi:hypothetical protein